MFRIHPRQNGFDLSITGHFLEVHVSEDDETCLYCCCDVTRGQGVKTLLLKLSEYTIDLEYQKGSEMHTSDALSRLQNIADTPNNKDIIPLNFLQHLTPNYFEHTYSHLVEYVYVHNTKSIDMTQVKRKCGRPPKTKLENSNSDLKSTTAATTCTA